MNILVLMIVFLPLAFSTYKGRTAHFLIWQLMISFVAVGTLAIVYTLLRTRFAPTPPTTNHDYFFVVPDFAWLLGSAVVASIIGLLLWAQAKWATDVAARTQKVCVWLFAGGILGPVFFEVFYEIGLLQMLDVAPSHMGIILMSFLSSGASQISALILVAISVYALAFRRK